MSRVPWNSMMAHARFLLALLLLSLPTSVAALSRPIVVKVIVVAMFEVGADTGDKPGELQYWVERDHLDRVYPLPAGYHAVRMNGHGEMAVLTGQGTAHAAATIMAAGPRPALRPEPRLLDHRWHRRGQPGARIAGIGALGALGCRRRPGLRDRYSRDSARLDHRLSAAQKDKTIRRAR